MWNHLNEAIAAVPLNIAATMSSIVLEMGYPLSLNWYDNRQLILISYANFFGTTEMWTHHLSVQQVHHVVDSFSFHVMNSRT